MTEMKSFEGELFIYFRYQFHDVIVMSLSYRLHIMKSTIEYYKLSNSLESRSMILE